MPRATVIYSHFHGRRTGVTRSVEAVLPLLSKELELYLIGWGINADIPRLGIARLLSLLFATRRQTVIWHAHRNIEMLTALVFRLIFPQLRLVYTRHSATPPSSWTRWLFRRADAAVALTDSVLLPCAYEVIGHGVDTSHYLPSERPTGSGGCIGIIGRVRESKGQHVAIAAAIPLLQRHVDWQLQILGRVKSTEKAYVTQMQQALAEAGVAGQCRFIDEVADPLPYYQAYDILLVPSFSEGFSMVTLEALACGCAVIATEHVGVHDSLIRTGDNGLLVPVADVAAWRQALQRLIEETPLREKMSAAARETVIRDWSIEREAEALTALYQRLASNSE